MAQMEKNMSLMQESDSIPGSGRSLGEDNGYSLQYSCQIISWAEEPGDL